MLHSSECWTAVVAADHESRERRRADRGGKAGSHEAAIAGQNLARMAAAIASSMAEICNAAASGRMRA